MRVDSGFQFSPEAFQRKRPFVPESARVDNVFRPGSNKPIAESGAISGDVTISGTYPRILIRAAKRPVTFANNTTENMKLCAYHSDAKALWCQTIEAKSSYDWAKAPRTFTLKVFRDRSPDVPAAIEANIPDESSVKIDEGP
jgi:hypothetical protein